MSINPFGRGVTPYVTVPAPKPKAQYPTPELIVKHEASPFGPGGATPGQTFTGSTATTIGSGVSPPVAGAAHPPDTPSVPDFSIPQQDLQVAFNSLGKVVIGMASSIAQDYPMMNKAAAGFLRSALKRTYNLDIDPDKTYLHEFTNGHTSHRSFNGWAHNEPPTGSRTLTQAVLANRQLHGDHPGSLDGYLFGVYSEGTTATSFDEKNEIRLLPSQLASLILKGDFYPSYQKQLTHFWDVHRADYRALAKAQFVAHATQGLERRSLTPSAFSMVMKAIDLKSGTVPVPLAELNRQTNQQNGVTVRTFDINGYPASDILYFKENRHPGVVLYMAGEAPPLRQFVSDDAMKQWVCDNDPKDLQRQNLPKHFSLYNRQDGATFLGRNGVDHSLQHLVAGDWSKKYINKDHDRIASTVTGDVFTHLTRHIENRDFQDANTTIRSSSEVNTAIWRERLELLTLATSFTAPFAAPIGLILAMSSLAQIAIGANEAVTGDTTALRATGIKTVLIGGFGLTELGALQTEQNAGLAVLKEFAKPDVPRLGGAIEAALDSAVHVAISPAVELINPDAWLGTPVAVDVEKALTSENGVLTVNTGRPEEATYIASRGKVYAVKVDGRHVMLTTPPFTPIELDNATLEWVALEPLSSDVPITSQVYSLIKTMKALGYRANEGEINGFIATRVFTDVRVSYRKGFRSANKIYLGVPKADINAAREEAAFDTLSHKRRRPPVPTQEPTSITPNEPTNVEQMSIDAANCGELSEISAKLVMENGGHAEVWAVEGGDHGFTVVGVPPLGPTVAFEGWKDVWIIDAWANIVCPAEEYPAALLARMKLWHSKGKYITNGKRIFDATDPQWLGPLANNPKRVIKQPTKGNPRPWERYSIS